MYPTTMNFAKVNEVPIVIIYTKFGEDRSISLVSAGSRISPLCLHLTTSHYNIACTAVQLVIYIYIYIYTHTNKQIAYVPYDDITTLVYK